MGAVALDASILIAFLEPADTHHARAVSELRAVRTRGDEFVLPISVLSEVMVGGYRNGTAPELFRSLAGLFGPARRPDEAIALKAAELRARRSSLRLPDAFVIATGIVDNATVLTCDLRLAGVDPRVQVLDAS
ncbi:MAG TPA: PIN domain-containing protein [Pseudonocardia sp.]|nr:PIN domain-containing protein [Pseudonocardia sp.]